MLRHRFYSQNQEIVRLFKQNLSITENMNSKVQDILALRHSRLAEGGNVRGRIRSISRQQAIFDSGTRNSISSDSSDDNEIQAARIFALAGALGSVTGRFAKIAKDIVKNIPESVQVELKDRAQFITDLEILIKSSLKKEEE